MTQTGSMTVTKSDDAYTVVITSEQTPGDPSTVENVEQDGNKLNFDFDADAEGATMTVNMSLEFEQDTFEGKVSVENLELFQ